MLKCSRLFWVILSVIPAELTTHIVQFMVVGLHGMLDTAPKPVADLA